MKTLVTLDFPPRRGGMQRYLHDLVRRVYGPHDRVLFASPHAAQDYPELSASVKTVRLPPGVRSNALAAMLLIPALNRAVAEGTVSVECGNVYAAMTAWMLAKLRKVEYRVYTYGSELVGLGRNSAKTMVLKRVLRGASGLYALGDYTRRLLEQAGVRVPVTIVPPRVAAPSCCRQGRSGGGDGRLRVLSVGRLVPHKGHHVLIRAMAGLPSDANWRLVLVGQGPEKSALAALAVRLGVAANVEIRDTVGDDELVNEYHRATLFVLPSLETATGTEGFGIVLLEAMSHRVPVVATRTGGIPEVLNEGECGMLVEAGNADTLAEAIKRAWSDPDLTSGLVERAYRRLLACYAWPT